MEGYFGELGHCIFRVLQGGFGRRVAIAQSGFSAFQLKIIREVLTWVVFAFYVGWRLHEKLE